MLEKWNPECNDKNNKVEKTNLINAEQTSSPTGITSATSLTPIVDSFLYIETSSRHNANGVFVSLQRTDNVQISDIKNYCSTYSGASSKLMGRFKIKFPKSNNT